LLDNGDELSGLIVGIADDSVKLKADLGSIDVKTDRLTAIIFNPALRSARPNLPVKIDAVQSGQGASPRLKAWVGLSDGSRLLVGQLSLQGKSLRVTAAGQLLAASASTLVFFQPVVGRAVYLSDLQPAAYRQTPYLDLKWPYHADRNVTGGLLRCGGQLFLKGLGVHSAARLVYRLAPLSSRAGQQASPARFEASIGIDDSTSGGGSVVFHVLVDGRELFTSGIIRGGDAPAPISVDVTGATSLELFADYADSGDVLDHADWLDARLVP
jgi:hypothetical protein